MRMAMLLVGAGCLAASPCFAGGRHLLCPAQVSQTIGDATTILEDGLRLYLDETRQNIVFEGSLLRRGSLSFKTTLFSHKLITANVTDKALVSYFDPPVKSGYLRLNRAKGALVLGAYLLPKGVVIETATCERVSRPNS
jgi:hypothetical protein